MSHKNIAGGMGTSFGPETTNQAKQIAPGTVPKMMSEAGAALASVSAPESALTVRITSTPAVKNQ
jgi:acyl-CoA hydrolase